MRFWHIFYVKLFLSGSYFLHYVGKTYFLLLLSKIFCLVFLKVFFLVFLRCSIFRPKTSLTVHVGWKKNCRCMCLYHPYGSWKLDYICDFIACICNWLKIQAQQDCWKKLEEANNRETMYFIPIPKYPSGRVHRGYTLNARDFNNNETHIKFDPYLRVRRRWFFGILCCEEYLSHCNRMWQIAEEGPLLVYHLPYVEYILLILCAVCPNL